MCSYLKFTEVRLSIIRMTYPGVRNVDGNKLILSAILEPNSDTGVRAGSLDPEKMYASDGLEKN